MKKILQVMYLALFGYGLIVLMTVLPYGDNPIPSETLRFSAIILTITGALLAIFHRVLPDEKGVKSFYDVAPIKRNIEMLSPAAHKGVKQLMINDRWVFEIWNDNFLVIGNQCIELYDGRFYVCERFKREYEKQVPLFYVIDAVNSRVKHIQKRK